MTIEVNVIPGSPKPIVWGELKRLILDSVLDSEIQLLVGTCPRLHELKSKRLVDDAEALSLPGYYYFELARDNTLSLSVHPDGPDEEGSSDYLDDFGHNLTSEGIEVVRQNWRKAAFLLSMSSYGGRAKRELDLLVHVASLVARLTNGVVVVMDNGIFSRPVGIYSPDEFTIDRSLNDIT